MRAPVRAINNLPTTHVRKDTLWTKKTETFPLKWLKSLKWYWRAEWTTEIFTTRIDLEFFSTNTNMDRGMQNLELKLWQMNTALMTLTTYEANDIVVNSRKSSKETWRRLQKRYDSTTGGRKRHLLHTIISPERCSFLEVQASSNAGSSKCRATRKSWKASYTMKSSLLIWKHWRRRSLRSIWYSTQIACELSRIRRLEIVTYVETKFGLRIHDSKSSHTDQCAHSDPMDVDAINSLSSDKGSSSPRDECFKYARAFFQRDCNAVMVQISSRLTRTDRASHDPRVKIKRGVKENKKISRRKSKGIKDTKHTYKGKSSKTCFSDLENSKSEIWSETLESAQICPTDNSWIHDGWSLDERNDDWSFDEWNDDVSADHSDLNQRFNVEKQKE